MLENKKTFTYRQLKEFLDKMAEQFLDAEVLVFSEKEATFSPIKVLNDKDIIEMPKRLKKEPEQFLFAFQQPIFLRVVE